MCLLIALSSSVQGCQPPTSSNGEGMIDDVIITAHYVICEKKTLEKDVVGIVTFDLTGLLPTNHIIAYITN